MSDSPRTRRARITGAVGNAAAACLLVMAWPVVAPVVLVTGSAFAATDRWRRLSRVAALLTVGLAYLVGGRDLALLSLGALSASIGTWVVLEVIATVGPACEHGVNESQRSGVC